MCVNSIPVPLQKFEEIRKLVGAHGEITEPNKWEVCGPFPGWTPTFSLCEHGAVWNLKGRIRLDQTGEGRTMTSTDYEPNIVLETGS